MKSKSAWHNLVAIAGLRYINKNRPREKLFGRFHHVTATSSLAWMFLSQLFSLQQLLLLTLSLHGESSFLQGPLQVLPQVRPFHLSGILLPNLRQISD